jgi:hypothetical protein
LLAWLITRPINVGELLPEYTASHLWRQQSFFSHENLMSNRTRYEIVMS